MDKKVKAHLEKYAKSKGWPTTTDTLIDIARDCGNRVHREEFDTRRWWVEYLYVREIDGMLIGYYDAETSGDMSADERGYEFDPSTICEMKPVEKVVITYEPV
jgi:hypothetical protein